MDQSIVINPPANYAAIQAKSQAIGFTMPSDVFIGTLLKTLVAAKPNGHFLELGTGIGLSLAWMVDGLSANASLISLDNDPTLVDIANEFFGHDARVKIHCEDGTTWLKRYNGEQFELVFADAWPGKYSELEEVLALVKIGGFYVIDDMLPQPNWPVGHREKAEALVSYLESREDFTLTKMDWSTGVIVMTRLK